MISGPRFEWAHAERRARWRFHRLVRAKQICELPVELVVRYVHARGSVRHVRLALRLAVEEQVALSHLERIPRKTNDRSEEHTSELQSPCNLVCRLLLEKNKHHRPR